MKFLFAPLLIFLCIFQNANAQDNKNYHLTQTERKIAAFTIGLLEQTHYSNTKFNDEMSKKALKMYFKILDPNRMFFLQNEVNDYTQKYEDKLDDLVLKRGDFRIALKLNDLLVERVKAYEAFAAQIISGNIDYTSNEMVDLERKNAPYPKNVKEMEQLWHKRIINEILTLKMVAKQRAQEEKKTDSATLGRWNNLSDSQRVMKRIKQMVNYVESRTKEDIMELFLSSITSVFDPHSIYMAPTSEKEFLMQMGLELIGIGAELTVEDGHIKINRLIPGGPADKSGLLKVSDRIIAIAEDGKEPVDLIDMPLDKAVNLIRGKENTIAVITILDGALGLGSAPKTVRIMRKKVELKDSEVNTEIRHIKAADGKMLKVGVIVVPSFYHSFNPKDRYPKRVYDDMVKAVNQLKDSQIDAMIIDMRSNGGGALDDAIRMCGLFVKSGAVVQIKDKNNNILPQRVNSNQLAYDGPLVVLVNQFAASATEIFAAAMQDHKRAIIVGDKQTHGKGTVQDVKNLSDLKLDFLGHDKLGSLKYTTAKFYRANGESTQLRGVHPDIVFPSFTDVMETTEKELDYALPFDTVPPQKTNQYIPQYKEVVTSLKNKSQKRIESSDDFKRLKKQIALFKSLRDKKLFSLNEAIRWEEFKQEKALIDEQAKLMKLPKNSLTENYESSSEAEKKQGDIYMTEALDITRDLYDYLHPSPTQKVK